MNHELNRLLNDEKARLTWDQEKRPRIKKVKKVYTYHGKKINLQN